MKSKINISEVMKSSGVKFGTSGARGLVSDITDKIAYIYTKGFLSFLEEEKNSKKEKIIGIGGDYRNSTSRIMKAVAKAALDSGYKIKNYGKIPSPTLAYIGLEKKIPTIMITGSHIPDDRNGIKYNKKNGEIMKSDEKKIKLQNVDINEEIFNSDGFLKEKIALPETDKEAKELYINRYIDFLGKDCLKGFKIGLYEHSTVGREIFAEILDNLGAEIVKLGFSDEFIPVDTEAIREEDIISAKKWVSEYNLDYIISADGDADRPLLSDENGNWLRGDVLGVLASKFLEIDSIATPVSCNSVVEKSNFFKEVKRTKIGSPYVIAEMNNLEGKVAGYEANGGYLINSILKIDDKILKPLPTRDAIIPILAVILLSKKEGKKISELLSSLPQRFTASNRIKNFPTEKSKAILANLVSGTKKEIFSKLEELFEEISGKVIEINTTDGIRITFENLEIIHLRPSGNAPEFRCYNEADSEERANELNEKCLGVLRSMK